MLMDEATSPETATGKAPVLVVDDEYGPRESVAFTLSSEFAVETAESAAEGLAKLKQHPFSAVILDIRMPEMDGLRALEELRKIDPLVSVIMLTGYGTLLTAQQAMVGGANQYLRKPPDVEELLEAVRQQAQATLRRRHQATLSREAAELNVALKHEIERNEPHVWHGRASIELVHDLNNPLTVVVGYATLLIQEARALADREPVLAKKLIENATMVEKAAEYCLYLSENWRKAAKTTTAYSRIDLVDCIQSVRNVISLENTAIQFTGLSEAPITGSKFELMRVFQNLLKNASEAGATVISVSVSRQNDRVELKIKDNGVGMDPERLRRALGGGFTSKESGMGIGLSICRHVLNAHGATFHFESAPDEGTAVRVSFHLAPAA